MSLVFSRILYKCNHTAYKYIYIYIYCHLLQTQNTIFSTLNCLGTFVWAYLLILFSVPLTYLSVSMPKLDCLDYNSVIINHNIFIVYKMPFASDSSISTHPFSHKMVTINDSSQVTNWEMAVRSQFLG